MYFSLVSSDFALFSQPWYIWYSHVHINNVYRNLRAMLTSTFPLRLNIFVFIFFLCHSCAQMDPYNSATYTHTKRLSLNTPKIRYGFEIPEKKTRKFISLISRRRIKFRLVNIRSSGFRGWFRFICQNGEEKKKNCDQKFAHKIHFTVITASNINNSNSNRTPTKTTILDLLCELIKWNN